VQFRKKTEKVLLKKKLASLYSFMLFQY